MISRFIANWKRLRKHKDTAARIFAEGVASCWGSALPSDAYYPSSRLLDVNRLVVAKETPRGTLACVENTRRPSLRLCERETSKNGKEPTERAYRNYVRKIVPQLQSVHAVLESTAVQSVW